jgi:hypothetical protein
MFGRKQLTVYVQFRRISVFNLLVSTCYVYKQIFLNEDIILPLCCSLRHLEFTVVKPVITLLISSLVTANCTVPVLKNGLNFSRDLCVSPHIFVFYLHISFPTGLSLILQSA